VTTMARSVASPPWVIICVRTHPEPWATWRMAVSWIVRRVNENGLIIDLRNEYTRVPG